MHVRMATSCCAMALAAGCVSVGAASPTTSTGRVKFEIHVPDQVARGVGGPSNAGRPVSMTFTNKSEQVVWLNGRAKAGPVIGGSMTQVKLTIRGPSGVVPYECADKGRPARVSDYVLLRPGEHVEFKDDVLWCFVDLFSHPGVYTAEAVYHDENPEPPPAPAGAEQVSEELIAEPTEFKVLAN
jgi:hypothetical protein